MSKTLADFSDASVAGQWRSVNDNVMGGVSEGGFRITEDNTLEFSGNLSLENRGGFTSIRTRPAALNLSGYDQLAFRLKGDGRTYYVSLMTSSRSAASYRAPVKTKKGTWEEVRVDMKDFVYTSYGRIMAGVAPLNLKDVLSLGITLADKKAGPFRLEIDWIKAEKGAADEDPVPALETENSAGLSDIVDTAVAAGIFKTLVAAVKAAGLVETLKGPGPFTVFAPTDEAFANLPEGTVESLLKAENLAKLKAVLTYHVVAGQVNAAQASELPKADTVQGASVLISTKNGMVRVAGANVVKADILASNGIIHVIDAVLLPKDIVETAEAAGQFETLLAAAKAAKIVDALKGKGPLTLFAPTDAAFGDLPDGTVEDLLRPENLDRLEAILKYHVVAGEVSLGGFRSKTLQGGQLDLRPGGSTRVNEAKVLLADVRASNGIVHIIDRVLLPELPDPTPVRKAMGVIELAIERGVPLYNAHKPEACAAVYEVAVKALLEGYTDALDGADRKRLSEALAGIRKDHRASQQAWILRYALDDVYRSLRDME
ncbi:CIA30 family protein [Candidatus Sumerlaeota bacterium]